MPRRIQRKRTKGWRMPENTVYVGRPTIWGNYFYKVENYELWLEESRTIGTYYAMADALNCYKHRDEVLRRLPELKGKNLACWCPLDKPCHADILLELANK